MAALVDPDSLIEYHFSMRLDNLGKVLQNMANNIHHNSKLLNSLNEDVFHLKKQQDEFKTKVREGMGKADQQRASLASNQETLMSELKTLATNVVYTREFNQRFNVFQQTITKLTDRLTDMEETGGAKTRQFVEEFVVTHVDNWYRPVREKEVATLNGRLLDTQRAVEGKLLQQMNIITEAFNDKVRSLSATAHKETQEVSTELSAKILELQASLEGGLGSLRQTMQEAEEQRSRIQQENSEKLRDRFVQDETEIAALFNVLCLEKEATTALLSDNSDEARTSETDRRVEMMHNSAPMLELRAKIQKDIHMRLKGAKEEDQDDFSKQIGDIQAELKQKVTSKRVLELVQENTDKTLYETVDFLKEKTAQLDTDKIGYDHFCEALKSKSDSKDMNQKADRGFVTSLCDFLRAKVDQLTAEVDTLTSRLMSMEKGGGRQHLQMTKVTTREPRGTAADSLMIGDSGTRYAESPPGKALSHEDRARIESALNPSPEYQWAAASGRKGMPPAKKVAAATPPAPPLAPPGGHPPHAARPSARRGLDGREVTSHPKQPISADSPAAGYRKTPSGPKPTGKDRRAVNGSAKGTETPADREIEEITEWNGEEPPESEGTSTSQPSLPPLSSQVGTKAYESYLQLVRGHVEGSPRPKTSESSHPNTEHRPVTS